MPNNGTPIMPPQVQRRNAPGAFEWHGAGRTRVGDPAGQRRQWWTWIEDRRPFRLALYRCPLHGIAKLAWPANARETLTLWKAEKHLTPMPAQRWRAAGDELCPASPTLEALIEG